MRLTSKEKSIALSQGWDLCEVYDLEKSALLLEIIPADGKYSSRHQALAFVTNQAKFGDTLAIKALTLLARYNFQKK